MVSKNPTTDPSAELPVATATERSQKMLETQVGGIYNYFYSLPPDAKSRKLELKRDDHVKYLKTSLTQIPTSMSVLDTLRPWICYWILHSLALLGESVDAKFRKDMVDFLSRRCQDVSGGYCGGPGQMPHLATTYAAVCSLVTLGGHEALSSINRSEIYMFLRKMKQANGGFSIHDGGEIDVRSCYVAICVASILNILDDELVENVGNYILSCQTYDGGISAEPGSEAHGGYTYCGVATMIMINEVDRLDMPRLIDWLVFQQGKECGFRGRTNKLVDCCYSFWQGGTLALLQRCSTNGGNSFEVDNFNYIGHEFIKRSVEMKPLFDGHALQLYILLCSQEEEGGLRDKPETSRDFYHTGYGLSGLSVSQRIWSDDEDSVVMPRAVLGPYSNLLEPIHPLFNVVIERYHEAREFFTRS